VKRGDTVIATHMPQLGAGQICRVEQNMRLLVTFPDAPGGPYADMFHPLEVELAARVKAHA
jgi:hypothetical protein